MGGAPGATGPRPQSHRARPGSPAEAGGNVPQQPARKAI